MELSSKQKGNLTELKCITACYEKGYQVSIPYGENSRYDFILDIGNKLLRIQVKTSHLKTNVKNSNDAITFSCKSTNVNSKGNQTHRYNKEQIDYFATYWNNECYLVPVEECSIEKTLWLNVIDRHKKTMSMAKDYELSKVLDKEVNN